MTLDVDNSSPQTPSAGRKAPRIANSTAIAHVLFGLLWVLAAWWLLTHVWNPLADLALQRRGVTVQGFIVDAWEDADDADSGQTIWNHTVVYRYRLPDGRQFAREKSFSGRLPQRLTDLREPYSVVVEYLPDNPSTSRIKGNESRTILGWCGRCILFGLLVAALGSPGIIYLIGGLREMIRDRARI